jgi:hypothetical protein
VPKSFHCACLVGLLVCTQPRPSTTPLPSHLNPLNRCTPQPLTHPRRYGASLDPSLKDFIILDQAGSEASYKHATAPLVAAAGGRVDAVRKEIKDDFRLMSKMKNLVACIYG